MAENNKDVNTTADDAVVANADVGIDAGTGADTDVGAPPADTHTQATAAAVGSGASNLDENAAVALELYNLLTGNPDLANRVADVIEEFLGGGANMQQKAAEQPAPVNDVATGRQQVSPELLALVQALEGRLSSLEKSQADAALDRELAETRQEYENLKNHFPILPELSDKEILQIALQYDGLPLKEALYLWAMRKLQEGEGSVVDRLVASKVEQSKNNQLPKVEAKGGGSPSGTEEPPKTFREARARARELLASMMGGPVA